MTRSRAVPYRWRRGPERFAERQAPTVGLPGGSSASIWRWSASRSLRSRTRIPASTIAVRSPASCSSTWSKRSVDSTTSPPSRPIDTRLPSSVASASASAASCTLEISKTLGKPCLLERVGAVRPRDLAAEARRGKQLARIAEPGRVEGAAETLHRLQVVGVEQQRHRADLVDPDAVLARERAARVDAGLEDRLGELLPAFGLALDAGVVEDERVQVAVAGVEDVADAEAVLALQVADPPQHFGQLRAGDDAVLDVVIVRDPAHRREGGLATLPEQRTLVVVGGDADLPRGVFSADRL